MADAKKYLRHVVGVAGSDLHLKAGGPAYVRVDGQLTAADTLPPLSPADTEAFARQLMPADRWAAFEQGNEADFAYSLPDGTRFRAAVFRQLGKVGLVLRRVESGGPSFEELGLPASVRKLAEEHRGLVLVTGPTGSGKSTTLAAMIDLINETRPEHILTVEDPIEFVHPNKKALVNQREVGPHTQSFASALKAALREDPDVILVGEMRDRETISLGLTAAETGHLVFGTLHTNSAHKTVDRIIDTFPADQQEQVRAMLSESLRGVVAQQLLRKKGGSGRAAAHEILVGTPAVANMIREGKTFQIPSLIQTGKKDGMIQMDQSILALLMSGQVDAEEAYAKAHDKAMFKQYLDKPGAMAAAG